MLTFRRCSVAAICFAAIFSLQTQGWAQAKAPKSPKKPNPAFAPVEDVPSLPRVLLIGDSISIGYTLPVQKALAGKANVHRPPENCSATKDGLKKIDKWLGDKPWDVIHFNWGLHDLKMIPNDSKPHNVPLKQYEQNLQKLVDRLKKTNAKLIWCSTTPVPPDVKGPTMRRTDDVIAYNTAARKIMDRNGMAIDDLYAFALPQLKTIQRPANVHYTDEGSKILAKQVTASIAKALGLE